MAKDNLAAQSARVDGAIHKELSARPSKIGDRICTVYLKLKSGTYKGAGSWGRAKTVEAARKIVREELRRAFGAAPREASEVIEWQHLTSEGWALEEDFASDPPMQVVEEEAGVDPFFVEIAPGVQVMRPSK